MDHPQQMKDSSRVRIRIMQRDGTCPTDDEGCCPHLQGHPVPYPRGSNVQVSIVNDDGTETRLRNVKSLSIVAGGREDPVMCTLELFNPVLDIIMPVDFLGEDRTTYVLPR